MTTNEFKEIISSCEGGVFIFNTDEYEGMIGISPGSNIIRLDDGTASEDDEAKHFFEFTNLDEMLESFKIDGELFADTILPEITELTLGIS